MSLLNMITTRKMLPLVMLSILLVIVMLPRFNRRDAGFSTITGGTHGSFIADDGTRYAQPADAWFYLEYVKYFRNTPAGDVIAPVAPFCRRPLCPLLASLLPFNEMTSLNIVNIGMLLASLAVLAAVMGLLNVSAFAGYGALLLFVFSFPTFYYGAIGYVDPALVFFLSLGVWALITRQRTIFIVCMFIGVFAKEGIALLLPVAAAVAVQSGFRRRETVTALAGIAGWGMAMALLSFTLGDQRHFVWIPDPERVAGNLLRFRSLFSMMASFGIPGVFGTAFLLQRLRDRNLIAVPCIEILATGFILSLLFCCFGIATVYADGRCLWPMYPFAIPLSALWLDRMVATLRITSKFFLPFRQKTP
jgi:hypothetical protein